MSDEPALEAWFKVIEATGELSREVKKMQRDQLVRGLEKQRDENLAEEPPGQVRDGMESGYNEAIALVRDWIIP